MMLVGIRGRRGMRRFCWSIWTGNIGSRLRLGWRLRRRRRLGRIRTRRGGKLIIRDGSRNSNACKDFSSFLAAVTAVSVLIGTYVRCAFGGFMLPLSESGQKVLADRKK